MTKQDKEVLEGEVIATTSVTRSSGSSQTSAKKPARRSFWRVYARVTLLLSFAPILGLLNSAVAFAYCRRAKIIPIVPVISFSISLFATTTFLVLWLIIGAIL